MTDTALTGREYLRVSSDKSGRLRSPEEQHADNERAGQQHGFILAEPYAENEAVSASRYGTKTRGEFGRLVADLEAGRFGADLLLLWESSRGSRKVSEWERLIEACEASGTRIHVTTHARTYDCRNARDRRSLREEDAFAFRSDDKVL